jgi:hypothetical protein
MPSKQHYLPAAFIGGFGHRLTGKSRREARIVAWDAETGTVGDPIKAERIGWLHDTYTIPELGAALEDVVDSVWDAYEGVLPDAAQAVSSGQLSDEYVNAVKAHVACAAVRLPGFPDALRQHHTAQGLSEPAEWEAKLSRLQWIWSGLMMDSWRWRAVHKPEQYSVPFLLPDTGFVKFGTEDGQELLLLPLTPAVGIIGCRANVPNGLAQMDHRTATLTTMEWLNHLLANAPSRRYCITHPGRAEWLERVVTRPDLNLPCPSSGGPYVGRGSDWMD